MGLGRTEDGGLGRKEGWRERRVGTGEEDGTGEDGELGRKEEMRADGKSGSFISLSISIPGKKGSDLIYTISLGSKNKRKVR